jgi:hypothetical protein
MVCPTRAHMHDAARPSPGCRDGRSTADRRCARTTNQLGGWRVSRGFDLFRTSNREPRLIERRFIACRMGGSPIPSSSSTANCPQLGSDPPGSTRNASIPAQLTFRNHSTSLRDSVVGETHRGDRSAARQSRDPSAGSKPPLGHQHWDGRLFRSGGGGRHA